MRILYHSLLDITDSSYHYWLSNNCWKRVGIHFVSDVQARGFWVMCCDPN